MTNHPIFIIITPVRDEERYIKKTIRSMEQQTLLPSRWIIINDGSTDYTGQIAHAASRKNKWIYVVDNSNRGFRKPAEGVIEAFYKGYQIIQNNNYDILAKLDGDLEFPPNMLELISSAFNANQKLGITGGTRYEQSKGAGPFKKVLVPKGFVGGPFKFYRKKCFDDIGGLINRAGWDGVDIIRAKMKGWQTGEIESLIIRHLKPTGMAEGEGLARSCEKYGDVSYYMGGFFWYFILRMVGRSLAEHNPKIGFYMFKGYLRSMMQNKHRESKEFRLYLKKVQLKNMIYWKNFMLASLK